MSFAQVAAPVSYQLPLSYATETRAVEQPLEAEVEFLPLRMRTLLIVGSASGLWAGILVAGYYLASALI